MSFLAPLFMLGALAVALPVVFHLIRRTTRQRTPFSSLLFLSASPPRLTQRSRLEHLLLLALRCLVLCLLALAFARPFFQKPLPPQPAAPGQRVIVLVDTSASMRRPNLWRDAIAKAGDALRSVTDADSASLLTFDREVHTLVSFSEWNAAPLGSRAAGAIAKLQAEPPGWQATALGHALTFAGEMLGSGEGASAGKPGRVILISDLQEGCRPEPLQGYEWPRNVQVEVEAMKPSAAGNASVQWLAPNSNVETASSNSLRFRLSNSADSVREHFRFGWASGQSSGSGLHADAAADVYVPPGQSRVVSLPSTNHLARDASGSVAVSGNEVVLEGDQADFDNRAFIVPPEPTQAKVVYLGDDSQTDSKAPLYYLVRAFQQTGGRSVQVVNFDPAKPVPSDGAGTASLVVVAGALPQTVARALREEVSAGKTLLFLIRHGDQASTLGELLGTNAPKFEEASDATYALLGQIDFQHPLFAPFADPRFSDFSHIHFWKHWKCETNSLPGGRVLAAFDNGDPALLECSVARGKVLVLAAGWEPQTSQLALSTKFVPLLYTLLDLGGAPSAAPSQYFVGDTVPMPVFAGEIAKVLAPDGKETDLAPGATNFSATLTPGIYQVTGGQKHAKFAVNLDPLESRTAPISMDDLERLGVPVSHQRVANQPTQEKMVRLQNADVENRQKLWRWFLVATFSLLLLETVCAGWADRRSRAAVESTS